MDVIIGTAGHIDHGKTTLVHALTGVDADRLPEEKQRGITIDIGFAEMKLGDTRFGFVDVPGHERFIKNMLAGVHGIDLVALVIAADEGVMPQTREHFDICRLLAIPFGLVVITKTDLVDAEMLELVEDEARELVAGSFLEAAPVIGVSARTGAGIEELKTALIACVSRLPARTSDQVARLPIDRSFTIKGFGAVVTGTLIGGELTDGEELDLLPVGQRVRVRGLQVHDEKVERARPGQRTAVNLGGIDATKIERGMTLVRPGRLRPTQIFDAQVSVLPDAPRPLRTRARVRVHLGAAEVLARIRVLDASNELAPGATGYVQLRTESPVTAVMGERFIIRSYSPSRTVAGGVILDPLANKHRGRDLESARGFLERLAKGNNQETLTTLVAMAGEIGLTFSDLAARTAWVDEVLAAAVNVAVDKRGLIDAEGRLVDPVAIDHLAAATLNMVEEHHRRDPLSRGLSRETVREKQFTYLAPEIFRVTLARLIENGLLISDNQLVRAAGHSVELSPADIDLSDRLLAIYCEAALEPPGFDEALTRLAAIAKRDHLRKLLQLLIDAGDLRLITGDVYCAREALGQLDQQLQEYAGTHEPDRMIDVGAFKELTGVSRKFAIPLLEYLDRTQVTRRAGDKRIVLRRK